MVPGSTTGWTFSLWCLRLRSAFRTILACTIVYTTTIYGPKSLRQLVAYPAYSYLTTILIVTDPTLGEALRGFMHTLCACVQVLILSILSLWLIGPEHFSYSISALAVALCTFVVALPGATHLICKRIAFGQIVIVYVGTAIHCAEAADDLVLMHPIRVALSTMLGASASVVAMLFPNLFFYQKASVTAVLSPYLAYHEVKQMCQKYAENARKRLNFYLDAISSQDSSAALDFISQAQPLVDVGEKLLRSIKHKQEALLWERPKIRFILNPSSIDLGEKLQDIEMPLRGIEIAATSCPSFPVAMIKKVQADALHDMKRRIHDKLEQLERFVPFYIKKKKEKSLDESFWHLETIFHEDLLGFFFLDCLKLLQENTEAIEECKQKYSDIESSSGLQNQSNCGIKRSWSILAIVPSKTSLLFAIKCSLSLGLAVLLGLLFNEREAYWAGLTIAISFVRGRQATFTVANARAQSTAMGSIYGILCCFIFHKVEALSFLPLLPWLVFTSFLRHSRMYGQAGGISAAVGALLILGRRHYGPPIDFAIARITEAVIGLICFITMEIFTSPARAATLAKLKLSHSLGTLQECIKDIVLFDNQHNPQTSIFQTVRQKQNKLKSHVKKLEKFIDEAEIEPNFWFIPFNGACYRKLLRSLSKMGDLSLFMSNKIESLSLALQRIEGDSEEIQKPMKGIKNDLDLFKNKVVASLQCLQELCSKKSLAVHDKHGIELGTSPKGNECRVLNSEKEQVENILNSFLQHSNEVSDRVGTSDGEDLQKLKGQVVVCLAGLGFCISSLLRELKLMEREFQELVKLENPSSHVIV